MPSARCGSPGTRAAHGRQLPDAGLLRSRRDPGARLLSLVSAVGNLVGCRFGLWQYCIGRAYVEPRRPNHRAVGHRRKTQHGDGLWRRPLLVANRKSGAREPTVRLDAHVAVFMRSRVPHFVPTIVGPLPQEPHQAIDRRHPGAITACHISTQPTKVAAALLRSVAAHAEVRSVFPCAQECARRAG